MKLFNTLTRRKEEFVTFGRRQGKNVRMRSDVYI